jgi:hypothetical protein
MRRNATPAISESLPEGDPKRAGGLRREGRPEGRQVKNLVNVEAYFFSMNRAPAREVVLELLLGRVR